MGFQKGELNPSKRPEWRKRLSDFRKQSRASDETKRRISETMKRRLEEPEVKEKWKKANLGRKLDAATKAKIRASHARRPKKLSTLMHKADAVYSRYIRTRAIEQDGLIQCFTCERRLPIGEIDCGHFVSRVHRSTRFMEENTQPQCRYCNRYQDGNKDVFAVRLIEKYGPDILVRLQEERRKTMHRTHADYEELIRRFS